MRETIERRSRNTPGSWLGGRHDSYIVYPEGTLRYARHRARRQRSPGTSNGDTARRRRQRRRQTRDDARNSRPENVRRPTLRRVGLLEGPALRKPTLRRVSLQRTRADYWLFVETLDASVERDICALDHEHNAAVPIGARVILLRALHNLTQRAEAHRADQRCVHALRRELTLHVLGTGQRQALVVGLRAGGIGEAFHRDRGARVVLVRDLRETLESGTIGSP